jgi:hypothetical protein
MNPHVFKKRKWLEYYNEVMVMFLSYCMLCMTYFNLDNDIIFDTGYAFISTFGMLAIGNLLYVFNEIFEQFAR